jgi:hypothetical protein
MYLLTNSISISLPTQYLFPDQLNIYLLTNSISEKSLRRSSTHERKSAVRKIIMEEQHDFSDGTFSLMCAAPP